MNLKTPVCILGAGPAGATTALQLNKLGIPCVVVDKAVFPRDKVCGDGLSGKVITALNRIDPELGEALREYSQKLDSWGVTFISPARYSIDIPYKPVYHKGEDSPEGFVIKRMHFDNFLVDQLRTKENIQLLEDTNIENYELTDSGYILKSKDGKVIIEAELLIVANGAHSHFTRHVAGLKTEHKYHVAGVRGYYSNVGGLHKDGYIELHFLKDVLPGYFWIFPLPNGEANVGVGMLSTAVSKYKVNLKKILIDKLQSDPVFRERFKDAKLEGKIEGYGLPLGSKKRKISGTRYMLIGDAGHLIDPFTGEGIGNAMISGRLAAFNAQKAFETKNFSAEQLANYDKDLYRNLGPELQLSYKLQRIVQIKWLFNKLFNFGMRNKQLRELMSCMFYEVDVRKKLTQPSFYLKVLLNRQ